MDSTDLDGNHMQFSAALSSIQRSYPAPDSGGGGGAGDADRIGCVLKPYYGCV
jgi:hypothetical protein